MVDFFSVKSVWDKLKDNNKVNVMYGMGDGADKIIHAAKSTGIEYADTFASDDFVRGQYFHGKIVLKFSDILQKYGENIRISLAFATSLPEIIEKILKISSIYELVIPDISPYSDILFDKEYFQTHYNEIMSARGIFQDHKSRDCFDDIISFRLSGEISYLFKNTSDMKSIQSEILSDKYGVFVDAGAYKGDTAAEFLRYSKQPEKIIAFEPDVKSCEKCDAFLKETGVEYELYNLGVWREECVMDFGSAGSRGSGIESNKKTRKVKFCTIDQVLDGRKADYIKYDVEGAEKEAIIGSIATIKKHAPDLCISLYHKPGDIFELPLLINKINPSYKFYLRRLPCIPAWDLNLYCVC